MSKRKTITFVGQYFAGQKNVIEYIEKYGNVTVQHKNKSTGGSKYAYPLLTIDGIQTAFSNEILSSDAVILDLGWNELIYNNANNTTPIASFKKFLDKLRHYDNGTKRYGSYVFALCYPLNVPQKYNNELKNIHGINCIDLNEAIKNKPIVISPFAVVSEEQEQMIGKYIGDKLANFFTTKTTTASSRSTSSQDYCPPCGTYSDVDVKQVGTFANKSRDEKKTLCKCKGYTSSNYKTFITSNPGILRSIDFWGSGKEINKFCYDSLKSIYKEIVAYGGGIFSGISLSSAWRSDNTVSNGLSNHVFGIAVDIQAGSGGNPYALKGTMKNFWNTINEKGYTWKTIPSDTKISNYGGIKQNKYEGTYDYKKCIWTKDHPIVSIFKKYGWGWGGTYGDTMHFSVDDGH